VAALSGVSWVTVGSIARRLVDELLHHDRFNDLRRIGIDEISYRRHHKYLTVIIDHDRQRVVWVAEGKSSDVMAWETLWPSSSSCSAPSGARVSNS
jgi:transposase